MDKDIEITYHRVQIGIPKHFDSVLSSLAREILRVQPDNIYEFAAEYFRFMLEIRGKDECIDDLCLRVREYYSKQYEYEGSNILALNGSAVIAMKGEDCAAIATDMRFGMQFQTISTDFSKVVQMGPRTFVGLPGFASDTLTVAQRLEFRKNLYELRENRQVKPKILSHMLSNLLYERRFGPYFVEPVVAGLDPYTDEPFISGMDLIGCIMDANDFVVSGTCTEQMYGMCETLWEPKMDSDTTFECISQCMLNALDRDCVSGWGVRVHMILKDEVIVSDLKARMD